MLPEAAAFAGGSAAAAPFPPCLGAFVLLLGVTGNCIRLPLITLWHTRACFFHTAGILSLGIMMHSVYLREKKLSIEPERQRNNKKPQPFD